MPTPTPADELAAAEERVRMGDPRIDIALRGPIREWLEHEAEIARSAHLYAEREPCGWCGSPAGQHALDLARAITATARTAT